MTQLSRGLSFPASLSLVVGSMIGTGIFLKAAGMAQLVGSPGRVLAAWGVAGLLSTIGALSYAEVGSRYPRAGGEYVYLREAYGPFVGFLYGWTRFWVGSPASVAAYGVGSATFLSAIINLEQYGGRALLSVLFILFFTFLNCLNVSFGGRIQAFITFLKVGLILGVTAEIFIFSGGTGSFSAPENIAPLSASSFGMAMIAALWAYDGWNNLPMASGEVINAQKNVPRSLIFGSIVVFTVYAAINAAYFYALPFEAITTANSSRFPDSLPVATLAAETFLASGTGLLSGLCILSALGAMNGSILTGARVPYAMAIDGMFFSVLSRVHAVTRVPVVAVLIQGILASALAISGTFDQLTEYVVFTSWIFYALVTFSIFRLLKRSDVPPATYRVFGYPWLPGLFAVASFFLLINTIAVSPRDSAFGLLFVALGVPAYFFFRRAA